MRHSGSAAQLEAMRTRLGILSGLSPLVQAPARDFTANVAIGRVGGLNVARLTHNAMQMDRGVPPSDVPASHKILMIVQLESSSVISQDGTDVHLNHGDIVLVDSDRPFTGRFSGLTSNILAYLPTPEVLTGGRERLGKLRVHSANEPLGMLARPFLDALARNDTILEGVDGGCARRMLIELGRGLIAKQRALTQPVDLGLPALKVRDYIDANLGNPMLTPAAIAQGCNISLRRLHRIFAKTRWTACEWLRDQRLQRCYDDLQDPRYANLSVTEIAFRWGFNDSAHFSRVFRQTYDRTPTDVRRDPGSTLLPN